MSDQERKPKAYVVTDVDESNGGVIFARFHAEARRVGACTFADGDWESVECRRAPEFDQYAPGPVSALDLIRHGWWFQCQFCQRRIDRELVEEHGLKLVSSPGDVLYCSPWCRLSDLEQRGKRTALHRLGAWMAKQHAPSFCTVTCGATFARKNGPGCVPGAYLTFPGSKFGQTSWASDSPGVLRVPHGDIEAYRALEREVTDSEC